jgi:malate/lactate dehydrogenase
MSNKTCHDKKYGITDVSIDVPKVIGKKKEKKIIELELTENTKECFTKSVAAVKEAIAALKN